MRQSFAVPVLLVAFILLYTGWQADRRAEAQGITPVPGRHPELRAGFSFCYKLTPDQMGCTTAEHKIEGLEEYWKLDPQPGACLRWSTVGDGFPLAIFDPADSTCSSGLAIQSWTIYYYAVPPFAVTPTGTSTPTRTATPTPGRTESPGPSPSSTATRPVTPTPRRTVTPLPTGAVGEGGNLCDPQPRPDYPHSITIFGDSSIWQPALVYRCYKDTPPDALYSVPLATYQAAWDRGPRDLIRSLPR